MKGFLSTQQLSESQQVSGARYVGGCAPDDKVVIRTEKVSDHPSIRTSSVYVSGQVATVLRVEKDVDPAKTKLLGWERRFEPLLVGSKKVVLEPIRDLAIDETVPLLVTLVDGTEIPFIVKPPSRKDWGSNCFREDGLLQVAVAMDHTLVRQ
ncbi:uncharacterized protein STAUR_0878 [Stigmatella aurantiaca DW4/3-1]|uniref:Uncharacterized protein n=1 Tax=Stigmatella aurantiaca (strain DW4/3-1) TaxID=378806 RepID=E3FZL7_STIAD|nr:uncharacterized protein STAUR_0878 [Stigmatella aurantiaca DW4/3-1]